MKKLQTLTLTLFLAASCSTQAELIDGFSNIGAESPRSKTSRLQASDKRIVEEMGNPVTLESVENFAQLTEEYLQKIKGSAQNGEKNSEDETKIAVKAVIDLFRANKQLPQDEQDAQQENLENLKKELQTLKLGRLQILINDMTYES